ncbi:Pentatricopeptide repeat-containing protein [Abeliophyllum distichum]|uniref:Pentatricopeptide repeat-containing protein n=1 Tax=Abeliophyllum distichum TaxID=126358 RepID=A0ABD1P6D3_9LAMI
MDPMMNDGGRGMYSFAEMWPGFANATSYGKKRQVIVKQISFCKLYTSASSVLVLDDDSDTGSNSESSSENETIDLRKEKIVLGKSIHDQHKSNKLFSVVVRVLKSLNWQAATQINFLSATEKYGFDQSSIAFMMMVHIFACAEMHMELYALLREIICCYQIFDLDLYGLFFTLLDWSSDAARSTLLVNVLVKVFASNRMLEHAVDAFLQAKNIGLQLGIHSCNFLLKCLAEANEREFLVKLFEEMKNFGPLPCVYTYTIMVQYYCNMHHGQGNVDMEEATNILEEMEESGITPSVVTYSTYIHGLCRVGGAEIALGFIKHLRSKSQPLNCYCYNAVIHEFCNTGEPEKAMQVLAEMKSCGITPDTHSFSILIKGFSRCGNIERGDMDTANKLFEEMINNQLAPNALSYKSLICGFSKSGSFKKALKFFNTMLKEGVFPNTAICNRIINGYCSEGRINDALQLIDEMRNRGVIPNMYTYSLVINALCKESMSEKALELIPLMLKSNTFPNVVIYSTLVNGFAKQANLRKENLRKAFMWYEKMLEVGVTPDTIAFTILINILCNMGMVNEAYNLFRKMSLDTISYTSMIAGFCRRKDMKQAWGLFQEMVEKDHVPSFVTYTCLIDGFCKVNRMDMVNSMLGPNMGSRKEIQGRKCFRKDHKDPTSLKKPGFCIISEFRSLMPVFAVDYSAVPFSFMHLHSSMYIRSAHLACVLVMHYFGANGKVENVTDYDKEHSSDIPTGRDQSGCTMVTSEIDDFRRRELHHETEDFSEVQEREEGAIITLEVSASKHWFLAVKKDRI